tara:strand:+ start:408 stop:635 length:228 start_codon:yes stop_codon:yes gene_type:complete
MPDRFDQFSTAEWLSQGNTCAKSVGDFEIIDIINLSTHYQETRITRLHVHPTDQFNTVHIRHKDVGDDDILRFLL